MSIVVAYQTSSGDRLTLEEAAREAKLRGTGLTILHVSEMVDIDLLKDEEASLRTELSSLLAEFRVDDVDWKLLLATGPDAAQAVLDQVAGTDVELLVIGARRRSPVGKMIMGSVTQSLLLRADLPVLVVKAARASARP